MKAPVFALIDCNNFFVSCERVFRPDLEGKPVIVLSSNDGCAVARSNEAKALGIPMAAPVFKYRHLLDQRPLHLPRYMRTPRSAGLDAAQGSNEKRANRTEKYGERGSQAADTAMRQDLGNAASFAGQQGKVTSGGVVQFSANFELYGDISRRIITLLTDVTPRIEIYSIDESFLDLSELPIEDYTAWGAMVRARILEWIGVPVSIGIAPSKTLAKLAADRAKNESELDGTLSFIDKSSEGVEAYLSRTPIEHVWGVGRRLTPQLRAEGVSSALHLAHLQPRRAQQLMGIHGRQMVSELNGISCLPLMREGHIRKSIARTRTFGEDTNDYNAIEAAIATFAAQAAYRLRESNQRTRRIGLFLTTNKHKPGYRRWVAEHIFTVPSADTGELIAIAAKMLQELYNRNHAYHRAGILLHDFVPAQWLQTDLLGTVDVSQHDRSTSRMQAVDELNARFGRRHVRYAAELLGNAWQPRRSLRSPLYTSNWEDIPIARIYS